MQHEPELQGLPDADQRALRDALARGDRVLAETAPVLRHFLAGNDPTLINDEVLARVRAMLDDLANQVRQPDSFGGHSTETTAKEQAAQALVADDALLRHAHVLALEGRLLESLATTRSIDPAVPPLIVELAASSDAAEAALAMHVLAAQARFMQSHHRMALPLGELPAELFHAVLPVDSDRRRGDYAESGSRLALLTRLALAMQTRPEQAMSIENAGFSLFATALALAVDLPRDAVVTALASGHGTRVALTLRAAGLSAGQIAAQLALLPSEPFVGANFAALDPPQAAELVRAE